MVCLTANEHDIPGVLKLHGKYQIDTIPEEDKKDGFVTTSFTKELLSELIRKEKGLFIAKENEEIIAYVMSASWDFWSQWPLFQHMISELPRLSYLNQTLSKKNSYQYGPVCVDKRFRGTGTLELIYDFARRKMAERYPILITFVNKINPRSVEAHTRKLGLEIIHEFEFNGNQYLEMAYDTSKKVGT